MPLATPLLALTLLSSPGDAPTLRLARTYVANEKAVYRVSGTLNGEVRGRGLNTWMPTILDIKYDFTTQTQALKNDGFADVLYLRPTMRISEDDGGPSGARVQTERTNMNMLLTLSPVNKVVDMKDLSKKPAPKRKSGRWSNSALANAQGGLIDSFVSDLYRLSLFVGGIDGSLDFAPPLPLREVAVGDTWKATVSYQPQALKTRSGTQQAVQRLDYTYTYQGLKGTGAASFHRVLGELDLDTDLAKFVNQTLDADAEETGLAKFPLKLKTRVEFDLDPKTGRTLRARASANGGFGIFLTQFPNEAIQEERLKSQTTLSLVSLTSVRSAPRK